MVLDWILWYIRALTSDKIIGSLLNFSYVTIWTAVHAYYAWGMFGMYLWYALSISSSSISSR